MPDNQVINMQSIETLRAISPDDGGEFLREMITIYLQDTPQRLAELEQALARQDAASLVRPAHSIKGSSGNFGAHRFAKLAEDIEQQGKAGDLAAAVATYPTLQSEYARVTEVLNRVAGTSQ